MTEGYADVGGARLWYWDTEGPSAALILCHPASQGCLVWENQRETFARAGYRVIGYSRRGHHPSGTEPTDAPGTTVDDLAGLMDALGGDQAHILAPRRGASRHWASRAAFPRGC